MSGWSFSGAALALALAACGPAEQSAENADATTATEQASPSDESVSGADLIPAAGPVANADQIHPGRLVYEQACAVCHDNPEQSRSPSFEALQGMGYRAIIYALTEGKMSDVGATLAPGEIPTVVSYLTGGEDDSDEWIAAAMCPAERRAVEPDAAPIVAGFGFGEHNHRRMSAGESGLSTDDFADLELAWALGFPDTPTMRSQPVVAGSSLFIALADAGKVFAFNVDGPPCVQWAHDAYAPLRSSLSYGEIPGDGGAARPVLAIGDGSGQLHLIDAVTGERVWVVNLATHAATQITGGSVFHGDRLYVPISSYEISLGANREHECCRSQGAVAALDAATGETIWLARTMEDATEQGLNDAGVMRWGPSGAPIWNTPSIDAARGRLYVGTGENTSAPATDTSDAIMAFDLETGENVWTFQATANDIFLTGCRPGAGGNCPPETSVSRDVDFGASTVLTQTSEGEDILLAGQKSGTVWALDPDDGSLVWRTDLGTGTPLGGVHWGIAVDDARVFAPINRPGNDAAPEFDRAGIHALSIDTGEVEWSYFGEPDCTGDREERVRGCSSNIGHSAAPVVIDGAVVNGSLDGFLRAYDAETGEL
ncbi:MAG: PQQ-binding-like beta-propeller repeat protein, partial [Maricaulaceae bacterium]